MAAASTERRPRAATRSPFPRRPFLLGCAVLLAAQLLVFGGALRNGFVYDDLLYVTGNEHVREGLTPDGATWALTAREAGHWHPLTWLSHMLDVSLFGLDPAGHHATNLLLHIANTLLLFGILLAATGAAARSFLVAALFSLHPLRVESVAWVADRKDLLAVFFALLAVEAWRRHARRPALARQAAALAAFAAALLAKSSVVVLPVLLLLLDAWPFARARFLAGGTVAGISLPAPPARSVRSLLLEKTPFLLPAIVAVTLTARALPEAFRADGADIASPRPWIHQLAGAFVMLGDYVVKTVWPLHLAVLDPAPESYPVAAAALRIAVFVVLTVFVVRTARRHPERAVGWGWYVVALLPVAGLVPGGPVLPADRYTYLPHIGLFVFLVWTAADFLRGGAMKAAPARHRHPRSTRGLLTAALSCAAVLALMVLSHRQVAVWRDEVTLFQHASEVNPDSFIARQNLGFALARQGRRQDAIAVYEAAVPRWPEVPSLRMNLGAMRMKEGQPEKAATQFRAALELDPGSAEARFNLANALSALGKKEEAERLYRECLSRRPEFAEGWNNLGVLLLDTGRRDEAAACFRRAVEAKPSYTTARANLALATDADAAPSGQTE